jgi:type II secretory pathway pseudopilin PulG
MRVTRIKSCQPAQFASAFTLAELIVAIGVSAMMLASLMIGYVAAARRAEWTAMSEAAQRLVVSRMEQVRSARWDLTASVPIDELVSSNFPPQIEEIYTPMGGSNLTYCTNLVAISLIRAKPPVKLIRVECHWQFINRRLFTNSLMLYRSYDP